MQRILMLSVCGMMIAAPARAADVLTIAESKPFTATSDKVQRTSEFIDIAQGQDKLQTTLTYYNGSATAPEFKTLQIQSPSMNYVTAASFQGKKEYSRDVTGDLAFGGNQIMIDAQGPVGATLGWRLTVPKPAITTVTPTAISSGQTITISGANLCPDPEDNIITINGARATCVSATANQLVAKVPPNVSSGSVVMTVQTAGLDAGKVNLTVSNFPVLKTLSSTFVAPGNQCSIFGSGFGDSANNVVVYMGPLQCPINSVKPNEISFNVPGGFGGEPWGIHQPLRVTVNGVRARNVLFLSGYEGSLGL